MAKDFIVRIQPAPASEQHHVVQRALGTLVKRPLDLLGPLLTFKDDFYTELEKVVKPV